MKKIAVILIMLLTLPAGYSTENLMEVITDSRNGLWQIAAPVFANPAMNRWRLSKGLTEIAVDYGSASHPANPDPRNGTGEHHWSFDASTYTRYRTSTLWGTASYENGKTRDVVWNETSDSHLLYPYLMADSVGGDLKNERYSFSGGYADNRGTWGWGGHISYEAGLHYRSIDPRPRNVTGCLDLAAGVMRHLAGVYYAGIGLNIRKYKQSNDIEFKSEMGVDKIFHLTGLGNHYDRFAGTGLSTYYDGFRYGLDVDIYPSDGRGFFATFNLSRFTFKNILSDLNKLPLVSAWHNELHARAGWLNSSEAMEWGAMGDIKVYRRHGTENVFGDAASAIFPLIGGNEMFADNGVRTSAEVRWGMRFGPVNRFNLALTPAWIHRTMAYIEPYSYKELNRVTLEAAASGTWRISRPWMVEVVAGGGFGRPYACTLRIVGGNSELSGLEAAERGAFRLEASDTSTFALTTSVTRTLGKRYAMSLTGSWRRTAYSALSVLNNYNLKISFIF